MVLQSEKPQIAPNLNELETSSHADTARDLKNTNKESHGTDVDVTFPADSGMSISSPVSSRRLSDEVDEENQTQSNSSEQKKIKNSIVFVDVTPDTIKEESIATSSYVSFPCYLDTSISPPLSPNSFLDKNMEGNSFESNANEQDKVKCKVTRNEKRKTEVENVEKQKKLELEIKKLEALQLKKLSERKKLQILEKKKLALEKKNIEFQKKKLLLEKARLESQEKRKFVLEFQKRRKKCLEEKRMKAKMLKAQKKKRKAFFKQRKAAIKFDDRLLFCDECQAYNMGDCKIHSPLMIVLDKDVPEPCEGNRAILSLPDGLEVRVAPIPNRKECAFLGVFACQQLSSGIRFGPLKGGKITNLNKMMNANNVELWNVMENGRMKYCINSKDDKLCNWMRYVNYTREKEKQNLTAFQYCGAIFFRSIKQISPGTELLVWHAEEYSAQGKLDTMDDTDYSTIVQSAKQQLASSVNELEEISSTDAVIDLTDTSKESNTADLHVSVPNDSGTSLSPPVSPSNFSDETIEIESNLNAKETIIRANADADLAETNKEHHDPCLALSFSDDSDTSSSTLVLPARLIDRNQLESTSNEQKSIAPTGAVIDLSDVNRHSNSTVLDVSLPKNSMSPSLPVSPIRLADKNLEKAEFQMTSNEHKTISHARGNAYLSNMNDDNRDFNVSFLNSSISIIPPLSPIEAIENAQENSDESALINSRSTSKSPYKEMPMHLLEAVNLTRAPLHSKEIGIGSNFLTENSICSQCGKEFSSLLPSTYNGTDHDDKKICPDCRNHQQQIALSEQPLKTLKRPHKVSKGTKSSKRLKIQKRKCKGCGKGFDPILESASKGENVALENYCSDCGNRHNLNRSKSKPTRKSKRCSNALKKEKRVDSGQQHKCKSCNKDLTSLLSSNEDNVETTRVENLCSDCNNDSDDIEFSIKYLKNSNSDKNITKDINPVEVRNSKQQHKCEECGKEFRRKGSLEAHKVKEHNLHQHLHRCNKCDMEFSLRSLLKAHKATHTKIMQYVCDKCGKKCRRASTLEAHKRTHAEKQTFECDQCNEVFTKESRLIAHRLKHEIKHISCDECGKRFLKESRLEAHKLTHVDKEQHACDQCEEKFRRKDYLKKHKQIAHKQPRYLCEICGTPFNLLSAFTAHKIEHNGELPFKCDLCGKGFMERGNLNRHKRVHSGERPYVCNECGKGFKSSSDLSRHVAYHTGEKQYSCKECGKQFIGRGDVVKHLRTHTGELPYACDQCPQRFTQSGSLTAHKRIHTGERPYACEECGRRFNGQYTLVRHMRTHTGERPYVCTECSKGFICLSDLSRHQLVHTGEKPFVCNVCNKGYTQKGGLRKHQLTHL